MSMSWSSALSYIRNAEYNDRLLHRQFAVVSSSSSEESFSNGPNQVIDNFSFGNRMSQNASVEPLAREDEKKENTTPVSVHSDTTSFVNNISAFYNQSSLSDVQLVVGDKKYYGHKFILANSSDVLRIMLYDKRWSEQEMTILTLNESEDCIEEFEPFLKFLYTASIEFNLVNVIGILCLADKYNVESLKSLCQNYMIENCKSPIQDNVQNALVWYPLSKALHLKCLQNQSQATIAWNARTIINSKEWTLMELEFLQDMLSSSDLVIQSEMDVYSAVERWLLNILEKGETDQFINKAENLLKLVRFPRMTIIELHEVENSELAQHDGIEEILYKELGKAYRFHTLCMSPIRDIQIKFADIIYQPRDYLDYQVDTYELRYPSQIEVKTCNSPLPDNRKDADWRLSYRKMHSSGVLSLHIQCQDSAMNSSNCIYESTVILYDNSDKIIHVVKSERAMCKRGQAEIIEIRHTEACVQAKLIGVLIKPVVNLTPVNSKPLTAL